MSNLQETEAEIEDDIDVLMSSDVVAAQISTKSITFSRAQSGWLFKEAKTVRNFYFMILKLKRKLVALYVSDSQPIFHRSLKFCKKISKVKKIVDIVITQINYGYNKITFCNNESLVSSSLVVFFV